jgi:hypothetical protein
MLRATLVWLVVGFGLGGCGGSRLPDPGEACRQLHTALCERRYACLSADELAAGGYPASEAACVTEQEQLHHCDQATLDNVCSSNERYQPDNAGVCVDQISALTCAQMHQATQIFVLAPACDQLCQ